MIPRVWLAGSLLSVAAVLWMGYRLLEQDRTLELEQQHKALQSAADAAAAVLEKSLLQAAVAMTSDTWVPASGAILVRQRGGQLHTAPPNSLLFSPIAASATTDSALFLDAERQEFAASNLRWAEAKYRELATSANPNIRAGALVRLARLLVKRGDAPAANQAYLELAKLANAHMEGVPAPLAAHLARRDGPRLAEALTHPGLLPSQDVFLFHAQQATELTQGRWQPDADRLRLSEAVAANWPRSNGSGRSFDRQTTILWHRDGDQTVLLAAAPQYVQTNWTGPAEAVAAQAGAKLRFGEAVPCGVTRLASATGLPWTICLAPASTGAPTLISGRRGPIAAATIALALMLLAAGYFTHRAVHREVAAARMQSDFVAAVSHEFRTPLTALRQFTDMLLERGTLTDVQRRTCYEAQMRSTERLSRLVEGLLDFRRMEAGARPYVMETLDAATFVTRVAGEFSHESGVEVRVPDAEPVSVHADAGALSLAVWNLLDNAAKYAPGAPIELSVQRDNGAVRIRVADHGPGIAASEQRRIFEKFVRGSEAETLRVKGTGIGLAMVKHVAEAHRGRIELESAPGAGSAFTIVLPGVVS